MLSGSLYVDETTQQSQDSDSPAANLNLNEDSNFSMGGDMTNDTDSNDVNNSMSAGMSSIMLATDYFEPNHFQSSLTLILPGSYVDRFYR